MSGVTALELVGVGKRFGGLVALRDVSFRVQEGELVALVGPNGAGKSTLFELISGNVPPSSGTIRAFGEEITHRPAFERRRQGLARTFQKIRLFGSLTVEQNIAVAAMHATTSGAWQDQVGTALSLMRLTAQAQRRPAEITLADRKKVEIARALVGHCKLLLLDESLSGLTRDEADELVEEILALNRTRGLTVIVVEHVMQVVVALARRMIVLESGAVIADGPPEIVTRDPAVIEAYLGSRPAGLS
jgi:branched-chain amino acid transport system ATP-binding protein